MRMGKKGKNERGSAAIEAVVCLTIFMVAIMTILSFFRTESYTETRWGGELEV